MLSVGIASLNRRLNIDDALRATVVGRVFSDFRFRRAVFGVVRDLRDLRDLREVREVGDGDCGREGPGMREGGPDGSPSEVVYYTK